MMNTVYVLDGKMPFKIVETANGYEVYRVRKVTVSKKLFKTAGCCGGPSIFNDRCRNCTHAGDNTCSQKVKFEFERCPIKTWSYKPYEDADAYASPNRFYGAVKSWAPHIIYESIF